jgi:hypothetical protein
MRVLRFGNYLRRLVLADVCLLHIGDSKTAVCFPSGVGKVPSSFRLLLGHATTRAKSLRLPLCPDTPGMISIRIRMVSIFPSLHQDGLRLHPEKVHECV